MPNIRESLYQCLENKVVAPSTEPTLELFTVDPSCQAYAITIYVVYRNTSFLEINLNSGMIKNGNSEIGYYRIRQAALQSGEVDKLYLKPSPSGKTYYLKLSGLTVDSNIFVRKDIKFGTYSKLLTTIASDTITENYKLTTIAFDSYNPDKAYSNGYFVESNDHTFVRQLLSKDNNGILGQHDVPFENAYVSTITTKNILNSYRYIEAEVTAQTYEPNVYYVKDDSGMYNLSTGEFDSEKTYYSKGELSDKLTIGEDADRINAVYTESVSSGSIDSGTIDLGTIIPNTNERMVSIGSDIATLATSETAITRPKKSGFWGNGILEIRYSDADHIYTQYVKDENNVMKQQIVVPGGLTISGTGNFSNAAISGSLYLNSSAANVNVLNALYIDENGEIKSKDLTLAAADGPNRDITGVSAHDGGNLDFVTNITQDSDGKVKYQHSAVSVRDEYTTSVDDPLYQKRPVNSLAVKNAIETLDVNNISGFGVDKTLATLSETDGKISATFQDITVKDTHVRVNEKKAGAVYPYLDLPENDTEVSIVDALDRRARKLHAHGYITSDGCMDNSSMLNSTPTASRLLIADNATGEGGKIKQLPIWFNTTGSKWKFINEQGDWTSVSIATLGAAAASHTHGNITNDGSITNDNAVEIGDNYSFVLTDNNGVVCKSLLTFDTNGQQNSDNLFKYLGENGQWITMPTLSDLGGSPSGHTHHNNYVRYDASQSLTTAEKDTARGNINAGRVDTVTVLGSDGVSVNVGELNSNGSNPSFTVGLPSLITVPSGSSSVSTGITSNSTLSYDSSAGGYQIQTPVVSVDTYGRVVQCNEVKTQTLQGHTADYSFDNGVLTITVR